MFFIKDILAEVGIESDIFVEGRDPRLQDKLRLIGEIDPDPDDVLLIHHSMGHDLLPLIAEIPCRKLLVYHNITPPKFFEYGSFYEKYALLGYQQLTELQSMVEGAIADSDYNAEELRRRGFENVESIALLKDFQACRYAPYNQALQFFDEPRHQLLFVGRIAANKGQLDLIEFMGRHRDSFDQPLHLTLVGHSAHGEGYADRVVREIANEGLSDRVNITGHIPDADLFGWYRAADAYISLSEHEGFGVPMVEAFALDLPVVAYNSSAISATLGGAGVLLDSKHPDEIAEALAPILLDKTRRRQVVQRQRKRLQDFSRKTVGRRLLDFLQPFLPDFAINAEIVTADPAPAREYSIEGPCETSYSLAIVNRSLGLGLADLDVAVTLKPLEGMAGYQIDEAALASRPEIWPLMEAKEGRGREIVTVRNHYPPRPAGMTGDIRLLNFFWEETHVPPTYVNMFNHYLDGIAVASEFGKTILRNSGVRVPIGIIGCGIDHFRFTGERKNKVPDAPFTFLHVSSGLARKGIEELFAAYCLTFSKADNVQLIIKTYDNATNVVRPFYAQYIAGRDDAPTVHVITGSMLDGDISDLYAEADVVVLPTRGEGFCLPAAEAMSLGVPTIVTNFSAHVDFVTEETSWPLDFDFEKSASHLASVTSMWVRPKTLDLALSMRKFYNADEEMKAQIAQRTGAAMQVARDMTWSAAASRTQSLVDDIMSNKQIFSKLKVAWVSTWNTKCGIADYSMFLVKALPKEYFDVTVFANIEQPLSPEGSEVFRHWQMMDDDLGGLVDKVIAGGFDIVVFQVNFGFFDFKVMADVIYRLEDKGIETYSFFHKTKDATAGRNISIGHVSDKLRSATRLIVHTVEDVNRLKGFGLIDNVARLPQGVPDAPTFEPQLVKRFLGMYDAWPVIATYGFLLPHKGIAELILAFSLIKTKFPNAQLLLLNGEYPSPVSSDEAARCRVLIRDLGLEGSVRLITEYLNNDDVLLMLQAADVVVYPYQVTGESSSAAVRVALAAQRPVAVTPLNIFDELEGLSYRLPGVSSAEMARGIEMLLNDPQLCYDMMMKQKQWMTETRWSEVGKRFGNMMLGLHEDRHKVSIQPPSQGGFGLREKKAASNWLSNLQNNLKPETFVALACHRMLGRSDDPRAEEWVEGLKSGRLTREAVIKGLESGLEQAEAAEGTPVPVSFTDLDGSDHRSFVEAVYERLLHRPGDPAGVTYYGEQLDLGTLTRDDVITTVMMSDEFMALDHLVDVRLLEREEHR